MVTHEDVPGKGRSQQLSALWYKEGLYGAGIKRGCMVLVQRGDYGAGIKRGCMVLV